MSARKHVVEGLETGFFVEKWSVIFPNVEKTSLFGAKIVEKMLQLVICFVQIHSKDLGTDVLRWSRGLDEFVRQTRRQCRTRSLFNGECAG